MFYVEGGIRDGVRGVVKGVVMGVVMGVVRDVVRGVVDEERGSEGSPLLVRWGWSGSGRSLVSRRGESTFSGMGGGQGQG